MPETRGGPNKAKQFTWRYFPERQAIAIVNKRDREHVYTLDQVVKVLQGLEATFGSAEIPLANNVAKLGDGTEQAGLGKTLLNLKPGNTTFAQGSSYLGVVLEELGYLRWNGKHRGIGWRLTGLEVDSETLKRRVLEQTR